MAVPLGQRYKIAVLLDGVVLKDVTTTRFQGYDTTIFITDGKRYAPMHAVSYFGDTPFRDPL